MLIPPNREHGACFEWEIIRLHIEFIGEWEGVGEGESFVDNLISNFDKTFSVSLRVGSRLRENEGKLLRFFYKF